MVRELKGSSFCITHFQSNEKNDHSINEDGQVNTQIQNEANSFLFSLVKCLKVYQKTSFSAVDDFKEVANAFNVVQRPKEHHQQKRGSRLQHSFYQGQMISEK